MVYQVEPVVVFNELLYGIWIQLDNNGMTSIQQQKDMTSRELYTSSPSQPITPDNTDECLDSNIMESSELANITFSEQRGRDRLITDGYSSLGKVSMKINNARIPSIIYRVIVYVIHLHCKCVYISKGYHGNL